MGDLVVDGLYARVIQTAARQEVTLISTDSIETDESGSRVVDGLFSEDGNVMATGS